MIIDQSIVEALGFSNSVLLDQCFRLVDLGRLGEKANSRFSDKRSKQEKGKGKGIMTTGGKGKKKFEKVTRQQSSSSQQKTNDKSKHIITTDGLTHLTTGYNNNADSPVTHHQQNNQDRIFSKVQIHSNQLDNFSSRYNPTPLSPQQKSPTLQSLSHTGLTVNDFLKQTAISSNSRNFNTNHYYYPGGGSDRNRQSPISQWRQGSGDKKGMGGDRSKEGVMVTPPKLSGKEVTPGKGNSVIKGSDDVGGDRDNNRSVNNVKKATKPKFQKGHHPKPNNPSNHPTIINPTTTTPPPISTPLTPPNNTIPLLTPPPTRLISPPQHDHPYDASTRATCQLPQSQLQKLMEVEDNKYKEIVLKTFYKHQK